MSTKSETIEPFTAWVYGYNWRGITRVTITEIDGDYARFTHSFTKYREPLRNIWKDTPENREKLTKIKTLKARIQADMEEIETLETELSHAL